MLKYKLILNKSNLVQNFQEEFKNIMMKINLLLNKQIIHFNYLTSIKYFTKLNQSLIVNLYYHKPSD